MANELYQYIPVYWGRLDTALLQAQDEGCTVEGLRVRADAVLALPDSPEKDAAARALLTEIEALPPDPAQAAREPSDWTGILAVITPPAAQPTNPACWQDRVLGAWLGRSAGCLLGKPFEGSHRNVIFDYYDAAAGEPAFAYFTRKPASELTKGIMESRKDLFIEGLDGMPEDDDTNYTALSLHILESRGRNFTPEHVAIEWMDCLPILHTFTAERVTYVNLVSGLLPPLSASHLNPYREWIGAQIRTDLYGYVNPGNPLLAAEMAWRDASISHTRNGLYGAMWASACLAQAFVCQDALEVIRAGLTVVPPQSRFTLEILEAIKVWQSGRSWREALSWFTSRWDEANPHHWCHTISNAVIVVLALLYGAGDYERTIGLAVLFALDTDCNAATAGSIYGALHGAAALPQKWIAPLHDTLYTGVAGWHKVSLADLARRTVQLIPRE